MLRRWTAYRLRMRTRRKEYMTTLRKALQTQRIKMMKQLKKKVFRGAFYGLTLGTAYYFGNGFYSEYHEMKQIKKKFLQTYP